MTVVWMLKSMSIAKGDADEEGDGDNIDEL